MTQPVEIQRELETRISVWVRRTVSVTNTMSAESDHIVGVFRYAEPNLGEVFPISACAWGNNTRVDIDSTHRSRRTCLTLIAWRQYTFHVTT